MTLLDWARFLAIAFTALALVPSGAHLIELPNKLDLTAERYLIVQGLYQGWALAGIVVVGALVSTVLLTLGLRGRRGFAAAAIGVGCIVATQVVFWSLTYPVNVATQNWTVLPSDWHALRMRWELSHATSAVLNLAALLATTVAVHRADSRGSENYRAA